ncbi:hypothetical protein ACSSS7_002830 [Eimeria intestinalis]
MLWLLSARWLLLAHALSLCLVEAAPERQAFLSPSLKGASRGPSAAHTLQPKSSRRAGLDTTAGVEEEVQSVAVDHDNFEVVGAASPTALHHEPSERFESRGSRSITPGTRGLAHTALSPDSDAAPRFEDSSTNQHAKVGVEGNHGSTTEELAKSPASSMLQVKQIFDQLLTGIMGTGMNLMQGAPAQAQAAAATPAFGPTPIYYQPPAETGMSTVEIVLIISGTMLALGLIGLVAWLVISRRRRRR